MVYDTKENAVYWGKALQAVRTWEVIRSAMSIGQEQREAKLFWQPVRPQDVEREVVETSCYEKLLARTPPKCAYSVSSNRQCEEAKVKLQLELNATTIWDNYNNYSSRIVEPPNN